jgi:hypothetical protein
MKVSTDQSFKFETFTSCGLIRMTGPRTQSVTNHLFEAGEQACRISCGNL